MLGVEWLGASKGCFTFNDLNCECGSILTALPVSVLNCTGFWLVPISNWACDSETLERALTVSMKYSSPRETRYRDIGGCEISEVNK